MRNSKLSWGLGILGVALVCGGTLGWLLSRQGDLAPLPPTQDDATTTAATTAAKKAHAGKTGTNSAANGDQEDLAQMGANSMDEEIASTNWEAKLDDVLVSDADDASKAASILALIPDASEEGKVELAQHLVNMVQDDNYTATGDLLTNTNTPSDVATVLMNDLLNRDNKLKLPMLLAVARTENHPLSGDAKELLELFIQDDKGSNWNEWEKAVNEWLKENADEEKAE
jgi:hypothetical protein